MHVCSMPCHAACACHGARGRGKSWTWVSKDTRIWPCRGRRNPSESLHKQRITHAHATCRPIPLTDFPSRFLQDGARWEGRRKGGIGATYRKSPGQKSEQCLQEASAPSLVTALGRQRDCALNEIGGQIGLVAQKRPSGPESGSVSLRMPYDLIDHAHAPTFIMNRN